MNVAVPLTISNAPLSEPGTPGTQRGSPLWQVDDAVKHCVWHRDGHVCRFCGFHSTRYLEAVVLGGNSRDVDHVFTACQFCHQCLHLPTVGTMRSGILIWLPEMTQRDLHHAAREIYLARLSQRNGPRARKVVDMLLLRRQGARDRLGTDDPAELAKRLASQDASEVPMLDSDSLGGIRLLPLDRRILRLDDLEFNQFPQTLAYWRSSEGPYYGEREFPWVAKMEKMLVAADGSATLAEDASPPSMPSYAALGAKLLRDAGTFFGKVAEDNAAVSEEMQGNREAYARTAELLELDPFQPVQPAADGTSTGGRVLDLAAGLLEDAAAFFETIGLHNPPLAEQMNSNAELYRELAHLVRTNPSGQPQDEA